MDRYQELLQEARGYYHQVCTLTGLCKGTAPEIQMRFNRVLQAILLCQCLGAGSMSQKEIDFIVSLPDGAALPACLGVGEDGQLLWCQPRSTEVQAFWQALPRLDQDTAQRYLTQLPHLLAQDGDALAGALAAAEHPSPGQDFLSPLVELIRKMGRCLAKVDGACESSESDFCAVVTAQLITQPWKKHRTLLQDK